jgi:hypothetical protein
MSKYTTLQAGQMTNSLAILEAREIARDRRDNYKWYQDNLASQLAGAVNQPSLHRAVSHLVTGQAYESLQSEAVHNETWAASVGYIWSGNRSPFYYIEDSEAV